MFTFFYNGDHGDHGDQCTWVLEYNEYDVALHDGAH